MCNQYKELSKLNHERCEKDISIYFMEGKVWFPMKNLKDGQAHLS